MTIFHIALKDEWELALNSGYYQTSSLESEGFIHLSTQSQLKDSLETYFRNRTDIIVLEISSSDLGRELRWEYVAARSQEFPHLYGKLNIKNVIRTLEVNKLK